MPSYPPRIKSIKKIEEAEFRTYEIYLAIRNQYSEEKLAKSVEKFRKAKLSLFKSKIHEIQSTFFKKQLGNPNIEELKESTAKSILAIEQEIVIWQNKPHQDIIQTIKIKYGI